jgi:exonuclease
MLTAVMGVEVIPALAYPKIIEVAAVIVGEKGKEIDSFESLVNPGGEIDEKALETRGLSRRDLEEAPDPENAANRLRTFLGAYKNPEFRAFNLERAKRLFHPHPWNVSYLSWGRSIGRAVLAFLESDGLIEEGVKSLKLYESASFFKIPIPLRRRALPNARVSAEIFGKIAGFQDKITDRDFLREAEYLLEDGL